MVLGKTRTNDRRVGKRLQVNRPGCGKGVADFAAVRREPSADAGREQANRFYEPAVLCARLSRERRSYGAVAEKLSRNLDLYWFFATRRRIGETAEPFFGQQAKTLKTADESIGNERT